MLTFKSDTDPNYIKLNSFELNLEKTQLYNFFKKKSKASEFNVLVDRGIWDGLDHFMTKDDRIPIGLWKELLNFQKKTNIAVDVDWITDSLNFDLDKEKFNLFVLELFKGIKTDKGEPFLPRDYQLEGAYRAIKYRFCCQELATSAGKTSIFYTFNSYLNYKGIIKGESKALLIVPNISLINQTVEAFKQYSNGLVEWKIQTLGGESEEFDFDRFLESNLLITTYQSLVNLVPQCLEKKLDTHLRKKPKKDEVEKLGRETMRLKQKIEEARTRDILSYFSVVSVDEAHKSRGDSITTILENCKNWKYRLGLSGTMKLNEQYSDFFKMQQNVGPLVMMLDAKFLIDNQYSPEVKIKRVFLEYSPQDPTVFQYLQIQEDKELRKKIKEQFQDPKAFGKYMLDIEKKIIFETSARLDLISNLVKKFEKNTLVLFSDIKNQYGQQIADRIGEWNSNTFYIAGETESIDRDKYKAIMEREEGTIIVASYGTFATGIDLKNVFHIVFAESTKAEITIRQAIGRGMRQLKGKHEVVIWDIVDDLKGYSVKHSESRLDIYKEQKFNILGDKRVKLY